MPTLFPQPCPKGPVVVSTPVVPPMFRVAWAIPVELAKPFDVFKTYSRGAFSYVTAFIDGPHSR